MALETRTLTIADLDRMDAEDDAREALRKSVYSGLARIEWHDEAA
jgi:hypothetical protein